MIRNDFVSNSSSSSFMIVGYEIYKDDVVKRLKEIEPEWSDDEYEACYELARITNADLEPCYGIEYDDYVYFGKNYCDMRKDETREEFEKRILKEVQKMFPNVEQKDIRYECQGGYNG